MSAPVTREEVMQDLRRMIIASADHLALVGPRNSCVDDFLGFTVGSWAIGKIPDISPEKIDLSRYAVTDLVNHSYDFAWQVGERENRFEMDETAYLSMLTFLQGSHPTFLSNSEDVLLFDKSPLWRTLETARARQGLIWGRDLDTRQLALLAQMTEAATRVSLSKEGIRSTGQKNSNTGLSVIEHEDALRWLKGRRAYKPTERAKPTDATYLDGDIRTLLEDLGWKSHISDQIGFSGFNSLAEIADVDAAWLMEVLTDGDAEVDVLALERIGMLISSDAPRFVGFAIERMLRAKAKSNGKAPRSQPPRHGTSQEE